MRKILAYRQRQIKLAQHPSRKVIAENGAFTAFAAGAGGHPDGQGRRGRVPRDMVAAKPGDP